MVIASKPVMPSLSSGRINPKLIRPEWRSLYSQKLRHIWVPLMNQSAGNGVGRLDDLWGGNHGTPTSGVVWNLKEGGRCATLQGDGGDDEFAINAPTIIDLQGLTVLAYVQTDNDVSSADPGIFDTNNSLGSEVGFTLDWNNPNSVETLRFRVHDTGISSTNDFMQQDRYYTAIGRYDGANVKIDGYDWNTDTFDSKEIARTGDFESIIGGSARIANEAAGGGFREWGGDIFLIVIWNTDIGDEMTQRLLTDPVSWLKRDNYYSIKRYFPQTSGGAQTITVSPVDISVLPSAGLIAGSGAAALTVSPVDISVLPSAGLIAGSGVASLPVAPVDISVLPNAGLIANGSGIQTITVSPVEISVLPKAGLIAPSGAVSVLVSPVEISVLPSAGVIAGSGAVSIPATAVEISIVAVAGLFATSAGPIGYGPLIALITNADQNKAIVTNSSPNKAEVSTNG